MLHLCFTKRAVKNWKLILFPLYFFLEPTLRIKYQYQSHLFYIVLPFGIENREEPTFYGSEGELSELSFCYRKKHKERVTLQLYG